MRRMNKELWYPLVSAVLCFLSFQWDAFALISVVSLSPFFYILLKKQEDMWATIKLWFVFAVVFHLSSMSWMLSLYPMEFLGFNYISGLFIVFGWMAIVLLLAFRMMIVPWLFSLFQVRGLTRVVLLAVSWVIYEWVTELGSFGFPWFRIALPLATIPLLTQVGSLVGSLGLSFLVVFVNGCIAEGFLTYQEQNKSLVRVLSAGAMVCVGVVLFGTYRLSVVPSEELKQVQVGVIQGNVATDVKWMEDSREVTFQIYKSLSEEAIASGATLVVWPETALPFSLVKEEAYYEELLALAKEYEIDLLLGNFDENQNNVYNSYLSIPSLDTYQKQQLVPFGEYIPSWMSTLLPLLNDFQLANQLTKASKSTLLSTSQGAVGSLICFESIFPSLSRVHVMDGADVLVVASNDAWYQRSSEITQHKNHAILRAIESNRYVIRAANTGISMIIDSKGRVISSLPEETKGILYGTVAMISSKSFYHQNPYVVLGSCVLFLVLLGRKIRISRVRDMVEKVKYALIR